MRGKYNFYRWRGEYRDFELTKVGEHRGISGRFDFDIYVDVGKDTRRSAFYIQRDGNKLEQSAVASHHAFLFRLLAF